MMPLLTRDLRRSRPHRAAAVRFIRTDGGQVGRSRQPAQRIVDPNRKTNRVAGLRLSMSSKSARPPGADCRAAIEPGPIYPGTTPAFILRPVRHHCTDPASIGPHPRAQICISRPRVRASGLLQNALDLVARASPLNTSNAAASRQKCFSSGRTTRLPRSDIGQSQSGIRNGKT